MPPSSRFHPRKSQRYHSLHPSRREDVATPTDEADSPLPPLCLLAGCRAAFRLILEYTTIFEYMLLLNVTAMQLGAFGKNALFYLAAAVSDFYIPWDKLSDHKIQSGTGPLSLQVRQHTHTLHSTPPSLSSLLTLSHGYILC